MDHLISFNGKEKQLQVIIGELAELITAIADSSRKDKKDNRNIVAELIDVELQLRCLHRCIGPVYLTGMEQKKYNELLRRLSMTYARKLKLTDDITFELGKSIKV